jgi:integrase
MPKKLKNQKITCRYFTWRLYERPNGMYYADGRITKSKQPDLGRHSLGTKDQEEAMRHLSRLDLAMAVKHGRADRSALASPQTKALSLADGVKRYVDHVNRPAVSGGAAKAAKRYKAVFDKFTTFLADLGVDTWQQVAKRHLDGYARWLEDEDYSYRTQYLELTTIKQALNHFVDEHLLPVSSRIDYKLQKPGESTTYCYTTEQVTEMIEHCQNSKDLAWLAKVLVGLAHTGLRISELAGLRWSDLDDDRTFLRLPDHSRQGTKDQRANGRSTKGRRGRVLPIHARLAETLKTMPLHADGRIFHGPRGGGLKPDTVRNILVRDVITPLADRFPRVGDEPAFEDGRVHSFRHYFCSVCADSKVSEQMLMTWLGHKHSDMVKHYYHSDRQVAAQMMNQITFLGEDDAA